MSEVQGNAEGGGRGVEFSVTSTTLLNGLHDPDNESIWLQFVQRYRPMIVRYGKRLGLSAEDAEDVAQASLLGFCEAYRKRKYERERGRLREWLFGIVHNQVRNWKRRSSRGASRLSGTVAQDVLGGLESDEGLEEQWEEEWRASVAAACLDEVRKEVQASTVRVLTPGEEPAPVAGARVVVERGEGRTVAWSDGAGVVSMPAAAADQGVTVTVTGPNLVPVLRQAIAPPPPPSDG